MATDRIMYWRQKKPSIKEVAVILEDYLGFPVEIEGPRIFGGIPGKPSFPFKRVTDFQHTFDHDERWIEVFYDDNSIDVITRGADEFTNAIAEGFYALMMRYCQGATEREVCADEGAES